MKLMVHPNGDEIFIKLACGAYGPGHRCPSELVNAGCIEITSIQDAEDKNVVLSKKQQKQIKSWMNRDINNTRI